MRKKLILMVVLVLVLGVFVFSLFLKGASGSVVLISDVFPYQAQFVSDSDVVSYECDSSTCTYSLDIGEYAFYADKEGYYVVQDSFSVEKDGVYETTVELVVIPSLSAGDLSKADVDESIFEFCYGDTYDCDLSDLFYLETDPTTGYVTLWEGEIRRGTFTKGMLDAMIFVKPDLTGAVVYDLTSFDAYFVNFLEDTRSYLFTLEGLSEVMFAGDSYIVDAGSLYWFSDGELGKLPFNWGLPQTTYADGHLYFLADASELGDETAVAGTVVGSYDGNSVYVIVDGLDIDVAESLIVSSGESVYVKSGESIFELREE